MTYIINKTDGNELTKIPDGTFDNSSSALTLIGRNVTSFGEAINENFVKLLENFASVSPPENAIKGQIWFDTANNKLNVYDGNTFRASGGPQVGPRVPNLLTTGDLWINNDTNQLYFFDGTDLILAGPIYTNQQGKTGFDVATIIDIDGISHTVSLLKVRNNLLGVFSATSFVPNPTEASQKMQGYGSIGKPVRIGFNAAELANLKFDVTVTRSESILTEDGTPKTGAEFVFNNEENTFTEPLTVAANQGVTIGAQEQARIKIESNDVIIANQIPNRSIQFEIVSGSIVKKAMSITGNGDRIGIFNANPTATLDIVGDLKVSGDLLIGGTNTVINSEELIVKDKSITLGEVSPGTPSDATADGGGIILKGTSDKTILYSNSGGDWEFSENIDLANGKIFKIGSVQVLSSSSLGVGVTESNIETLGTLNQFTMKGFGVMQIGDNFIRNVTGNIVINPQAPFGAVDVSSKKIVNLQLPTALADAANKEYVDREVYTRDISFSMDITGLRLPDDSDDNNPAIAEILDDIAPFYDPVTASEGVAATNTKLRLHATRIAVTNGPVVANTGDFNVSRATVSGTEVLTEVNSAQFNGSQATVTVTRQNKLFQMGYGPSGPGTGTPGKWGFVSDF
jgi:hypothetical protein